MKKLRKLAALCAVLALMLCSTTIAYASGGEERPEPTPTPTATPEPTKAPNPFSLAGTGTVIDNATDEDGKEFFTIMTPDENTFYLVIDRQRETENVYFLNAVTEKDLLALAEKAEETDKSADPTPVSPEPTPKPEPEPEPAPEPQKGGGMGMMIFVVLALLAVGGAGYYFKIYRPKRQANAGEEYDEYEADTADQEDDTPLWDEDESSGDGEA